MGGPSKPRKYGGGGGGGSGDDQSQASKINRKIMDDIIRGDLNSEIKRAKKKSEENVLSQFIDRIKQSVLTGIIIGALSAVPIIGPLVIPIYTAYKIGTACKNVINAYNQARSDKESAALKAGEKEVIKYVAGEITGAVVEQSAGLVGEGVRTFAEKSGAISEIAKATNVSGDVLGRMLQGSVENGIKEGAQAFSDFVIERSM